MKAAPPSLSWAWALGQAAQGLVVGVLLVAAVVGLLALTGDVPPFRYQGF